MEKIKPEFPKEPGNGNGDEPKRKDSGKPPFPEEEAREIIKDEIDKLLEEISPKDLEEDTHKTEEEIKKSGEIGEELTERYRKWRDENKHPMTPEEFSEFLKDRR